MTAYRNDEYGTGASRGWRFYGGVFALAGTIGTALAVLAWS